MWVTCVRTIMLYEAQYRTIKSIFSSSNNFIIDFHIYNAISSVKALQIEILCNALRDSLCTMAQTNCIFSTVRSPKNQHEEKYMDIDNSIQLQLFLHRSIFHNTVVRVTNVSIWRILCFSYNNHILANKRSLKKTKQIRLVQLKKGQSRKATYLLCKTSFVEFDA